jgi:hypothetical protein
MQQLQLGIFVAAMIAIVVCGLHLHAETKKGPLNTGPRDEARRIAANIVKLLGC